MDTDSKVRITVYDTGVAKQIPYDFLEFNFSRYHYPGLGYSSKKKRKPQIFGLKNVIERGKILTFKIFGKIILKPLS